MTSTNLTLFFRQLKNQKSYAFINFLGLTIGLATALLIGQYVLNEWTADGFIPHPERTFRLVRTSEINGAPYNIGVTSAPFATTIEQDYPDDVEATTRVINGNSLVSIGDKTFQEGDYLYVDPNFVSFFGLPLLHGDPNSVLAEANRIVLSKRTAEKYFGTTANAVGKTLKIDNSYDAIVSGVFDDLGYQSHLKFELVESNQALYSRRFWNEWWSNSLVTYLRLPPKVSAQNFNARLPNFMEKYFGDDFERMNARVGLQLEPVNDIYFAADTRYDPVQHGNRAGVLVFFFAAILLIVVACINYINLSTATAITRSREMAIHKVLGSGRAAIVWRMLVEAGLLTGISLLVALYISYLGRPWFEDVLNTNFIYQLPVGYMALFLLGLGIIVSLASGLYPGALMASFQPKKVLNSKSTSGIKQTNRLRKGLVVFQYALSTVLLCSTFVIYQQLEYLGHKDLGFDKEQVLIIPINNREISQQKGSFKNQVMHEPGIHEVSFTLSIPGGFYDATSIDVPALQSNIRMRVGFIDFNIVQTMGMEIVAGRNFNGNMATDSTQAVLLNEQAVKDIGMTTEEAIGQTLYMTSFDTLPRKVVGIVKDFNFTSLHDQIEPLIIGYSQRPGVIALKVSSDRIPESIAAAEKAWTNLVPAFPFNYSFLDERLDQQYQSELKQGRIFAFFALIAIFIACLGILGLSAFSASVRTKEIGVRKVLGASVLGIVKLLSKDFLKLVLVACLLAIPFAWYLMSNWLEGFAYKISIEWWVFIVAGLAGLLVSLLTVSVHSVRAALANPVESLKTE